MEFARANGARLRRTAYLMCHDWHLAEDLTQHTLTKLYVAWGRNGPPDTPLAYAQRILIHAVLDHRRLRSSSEIATGDLPDGVSFRPGDLRLTVVEAIRQLSPSDRVVVVLRYWEDLSVEQTAHLLGLSQAAVKARSARALRRLRVLLGEDDDAAGSAPMAGVPSYLR